jgi:GH18 family chitinase
MKAFRAEVLVLISITVMVATSCRKKSIPAPGTTVTPEVIAPPPAFGFYVVGYLPSYRDPATIPDVKFRMCNVINYAFASVTSAGGLTISDPARLIVVANKAKANSAKIMLSISGAHADFKNMAANAAGRTNFVKLLMNAVRQYSLNGVDMDWEYPTTTDGTDVTYTALMKELSDSCHRGSRYYLTAAITPGKYAGGARDAIRSELFPYVDWFNIMAYDDFSTTTPYRHHSDFTLAQTALNYWINTRGMPASKAVLGLPAYGRPSGITQTGTVLTYSGILGQGGSPLSDSATVTAGSFTNYKIYYNGQPTIKKKAMLAKTMANGVMLWEKGQDTHDNNSLLKAVCDTIGRPY